MLAALLTIGLLDLAVLITLAIALYRAPEGYQTQDGFHFGSGYDVDDFLPTEGRFEDVAFVEVLPLRDSTQGSFTPVSVEAAGPAAP